MKSFDNLKRYFNAMLYGSRNTKIYLWSVLAGMAATLISLVLALVKLSWVGGLVTLFLAVLTVIVWQSKTLTDKEIQVDQKTRAERKAQTAEKKRTGKNARANDEASVDGNADAGERARTGKNARANDEMSAGGNVGAGERARKRKQAEEEAGEVDYDRYTQEVITKSMHRYRVKGEHRTVMIDSWRSGGAAECPAYLWKDRRYAYLLLLEETPRRVRFPLEKMVVMTYEPEIPVRESDYAAVKKSSLIGSVFHPFLPDSYQEIRNSHIVQKKNLYCMAGDLKFTNTSVRNVLDVLSPSFEVKDEVTKDSRHDGYFLQSYRLNILLRDSVLTVKEYKERIKENLQDMAQSNMDFDRFRKNLEQMVQYRFITDEFADYFINYRNSWLLKQQAKQTKGRRK